VNIEVDMGKIAAAKYKEVDHLTSTGVGSCLVITLYDPKLKLGAIAHAMLSHETRHANAKPDAIYIDTAIEQMLEELLSRGAVRERLEAKIVGAANMFVAFKSDVPMRNVVSAKEKLKQEGIRLVGECVGGSIGRSVELALDTGIITVKTKF
jgi:chemotaxis protein CheD